MLFGLKRIGRQPDHAAASRVDRLEVHRVPPAVQRSQPTEEGLELGVATAERGGHEPLASVRAQGVGEGTKEGWVPPDLEQIRDAVGEHVLDGAAEVDWLAHVPRPVARVEAAPLDRGAGDGGVDRARGWARAQASEGLDQRGGLMPLLAAT